MVNLTSLERVLNIKLKEYKEYIAAHSRSVLVVFFFLPMIVSKIAILIGVTNIGFVLSWETACRAAFGSAEGYSLTVLLYWLMSPLAFLWIFSQVNYQSTSFIKMMIIVPSWWLIIIALGVIVFGEVKPSFLEYSSFSRARIFSLMRWHWGFCMLYGGLVFCFCTMIYGASYLTLRLISNRL
ncbi:hypothetical protein XfCFBP8351_05815 [Xylella fastidiosa subsp. fastidiosa]|uniref:hypothetical protein n=1 Tax=Xylella fastidiosa TaxID=2371 RepID=UPI000FFEA65C|nr:hypothetical protein [Xylella fastidiosa]RWA41620.1 hypothetical protein XfCFBP8351_05815 [Xylella fastidiosa subsp. fastidiosa]